MFRGLATLVASFSSYEDNTHVWEQTLLYSYAAAQ